MTVTTPQSVSWRPSASLRVATGRLLDRRLAASLLAAIAAFTLLLAAAPTTSGATGAFSESRVAAQTSSGQGLVGPEAAGSPMLVGANGVYGYDGVLGCCVAPRTALVDDVGDVAFRSNTSHIFRDKSGHLLTDTAANRALITKAVRPANLVDEVTAGSSTIRTYQQLLPDGSQVWAQVRNGVEITNGGLNLVPR